MTTLTDLQEYLRQKRATGRLSPGEMEAGYKSYYETEAGQAIQRGQLDLQAKRDRVLKKATNRKLTLMEEQQEQANDAAAIQGRLQMGKIIAPDMFKKGGLLGGQAQVVGDGEDGLGGQQGTNVGGQSTISPIGGQDAIGNSSIDTGETAVSDLDQSSDSGFMGINAESISDSLGDIAQSGIKGALASTALGMGPVPGLVSGGTLGLIGEIGEALGLDNIGETISNAIQGLMDYAMDSLGMGAGDGSGHGDTAGFGGGGSGIGGMEGGLGAVGGAD